MALFEEEDDAWGASPWGVSGQAPLKTTLPVWTTDSKSETEEPAQNEETWEPPSLLPALDQPLDEADTEEWAASTATAQEPPEATDDFDDFGDFDDPDGVPDAQDDAFGDFGGFEEETGFDEPVPSTSATTLSTQPITFSKPVEPQISHLLALLFPLAQADLSDAPDRDITDHKQLLDPPSIELMNSILSPQHTAVTTWKRSNIRKLHLEALGIRLKPEEVSAAPVDETLKAKTPQVQIRTDVAPAASPQSAPVSIRSSVLRSRTTSPAPVLVLDRRKAAELLALTPDELQGMPVDRLKEIQAGLEELVRVASETLALGVEQRERLRADGETYDQMIQDLVSTAQKLKPSATALKRTGSLQSGVGNRIFGARTPRSRSPLQASAPRASMS